MPLNETIPVPSKVMVGEVAVVLMVAVVPNQAAIMLVAQPSVPHL